MKKLKESGMLYAVIAAAVILVIGLIEFLGKQDGQVSGLQILLNQTGGEWLRMIFGTLGIAGVVYLYNRYYLKKQDATKNSWIAFSIALMLFAAIAFAKGCDDKANDGVTSGNGRPSGAAQVDSSRVAAEDLLKK